MHHDVEGSLFFGIWEGSAKEKRKESKNEAPWPGW